MLNLACEKCDFRFTESEGQMAKAKHSRERIGLECPRCGCPDAHEVEPVSKAVDAVVGVGMAIIFVAFVFAGFLVDQSELLWR